MELWTDYKNPFENISFKANNVFLLLAKEFINNFDKSFLFHHPWNLNFETYKKISQEYQSVPRFKNSKFQGVKIDISNTFSWWRFLFRIFWYLKLFIIKLFISIWFLILERIILEMHYLKMSLKQLIFG